MITARKWFVNNAPIILLAPFSLVVGMWIYDQKDILMLEKNLLLFYFYIFFTLLPLFFLIFRPRQELGEELVEAIGKFRVRFLESKWIYLAIGTAFSVLYLYFASIHISTYYERDRWILSGDLPILPIDMILPSRLALVVSWLFPIDFAIPLVNLLIILLWLAFLIYINSGENKPWEIIFFTFTSTFLTGLFYTTQYATFEFPAAVLSFIGLYGIWRRKFSIGLFLLVIGSVFKNTGIFQLLVGCLMFLYICLQEKSVKKVFQKLDPALTVFLGFFFLANHWGQFYYIFIMRGGPQYLIEPNANNIFWVSSFIIFMKVIFSQYTVLFVFGLIGAFLSGERRLFGLLSLGLLLILRSFSKWADEAYATILIPAFSFFSLYGLAHVWKFLKSVRTNWLLVLCLLGINVYTIYGLLQNIPSGMHRLNSNFDEFIGKMARRFPEDGRIYERDMSLIPYLKFARGGDLDAIRFRVYPDNKTELMNELSQMGCKLIIAEKRHLDIVGITDAEMISLGYSKKPYELLDNSGTWIAYSKECNAWEYN